LATREFSLTVNGTAHRVSVDPEEPLLWVLRDHLRLTGTKFGCGEGSCGACSVLIDGQLYRSCMVAVGEFEGSVEIVTIEGLGRPGELSPLQAAFVDHTAFGCGYCTPGMIVAATALLRSNPKPTHEEIVAFMDDNLCRCASHPAIVAAVEAVARSGVKI
jgi:aerobic-type carbon monoxide dehydrogenase small subunit (CoxS/CutS family)